MREFLIFGAGLFAGAFLGVAIMFFLIMNADRRD